MADYDRPISLRLPTSVLADLDRRTTKPHPAARGEQSDPDREWTRGQALRAAVGRYYEVCRRHLAALDLSRSELAVCCDVLNGGMLDLDGDDHAAARLSIVWAEIADAFRLHKGYGDRHGVSDEQGAKLIAKLQAASYADLVALVDFVERFWADDPAANKVIYPDGDQ